MGSHGHPHRVHYAGKGWMDKVAYATQEEAEVAALATTAGSRRPAPFGHGVYRCPYCPAWHVGRKGTGRPHWRRTEREIALQLLYWAIWRHVNRKPQPRHQRDSRVI